MPIKISLKSILIFSAILIVMIVLNFIMQNLLFKKTYLWEIGLASLLIIFNDALSKFIKTISPSSDLRTFMAKFVGFNLLKVLLLLAILSVIIISKAVNINSFMRTFITMYIIFFFYSTLTFNLEKQ